MPTDAGVSGHWKNGEYAGRDRIRGNFEVYISKNLKVFNAEVAEGRGGDLKSWGKRFPKKRLKLIYRRVHRVAQGKSNSGGKNRFCKSGENCLTQSRRVRREKQ